VVGRKAKLHAGRREKEKTPAPATSQKSGKTKPPAVGKRGGKTLGISGTPAAAPPTRIRLPRSAAVTITLPSSSGAAGWTYARVLTQARCRVPLGALGISALRIKNSRAEARVLEIPGEGSTAKAEKLADELREALADTPAKVQCPVKTADLRVTGLDETVTPMEVERSLADVGGCLPFEVKVGLIRPGPGGAGSVWARCPVEAANKLAAAGRVCIGWTVARVHLLVTRPFQCYRCLALGHARDQ